MRIHTCPPQVIGKCKYGIWQVRVDYFDGRSVLQNYFAFSSSEAMRRYLQENGAVKQGIITTKFIKKAIDK